MAKTVSRKRGKHLLLDSDLLGFAAAAFVGTVVMALGFWQQVDGFEIAYRSGVAFVITYAVVFLLVRFILHTVLAEMIERKKKAEEARQARAESDAASASEGEQP